MVFMIISLVLADTSSGISLSLPENWVSSDQTMAPGLTLTCGKLKAVLHYRSVMGNGWTQLDVIRVNQEKTKEFMEASRYSKQGAMEEIAAGGAVLYRSWACAMKSDGDHVIYIITAGWRIVERGTVNMFMEMRIERPGALKFSQDEEEAIDQLLRGFSFQ
ncbi:MAG: hypothetical protein ACP5QG_02170 [candidate division WOR-3 bacterium]